ncbi:hypothetical protein [Arenimonas terrae]|uniref:DUF4019 domain-containing protein n=1 Tax=Arenimonas terrae TaxID=2546226 RepID=A0A5C4RXL0_9GAMM|nr:hypothetical protein [Arenimonas terrae]TNJ35774.1 hypothetical protein E1B00_08530 [Arenimonas terrae]
MRTATLPLALAALGLGLLPTLASARVEGHCEYEGRKVALVDGAAWAVPEDPEDDDDEGYEDDAPEVPSGPPLMLAFVTFAVDAGALARATDREDALRDQSWAQDESARLELTVEDGVVGQQYLWISPGTNISYSSNEVGQYKAAAGAKGRVSGEYRFTPEDGQELDCRVSFDLALLGDPKDAPPPPGTPLPPGGGEPGAAYLAMNKALHAGDFDAMLALMPADRAAMMRDARKDPDFAAQMALAQAMSPSKVKITGGRQDGDRAWVEFTAVEAGSPRVGTAEMVREGGRWIMLKESTRDPD